MANGIDGKTLYDKSVGDVGECEHVVVAEFNSADSGYCGLSSRLEDDHHR